MKKLKKVLRNPQFVLSYLLVRTSSMIRIPDKIYLRWLYFLRTGKHVFFDDRDKRFTAQLQSLKLSNRGGYLLRWQTSMR